MKWHFLRYHFVKYSYHFVQSDTKKAPETVCLGGLGVWFLLLLLSCLFPAVEILCGGDAEGFLEGTREVGRVVIGTERGNF